jgi:hypothetical protein
LQCRTIESPKAPDCMARLEGSGKGSAVCAKAQSDWEDLLEKKKQVRSTSASGHVVARQDVLLLYFL